MAQSRYLLIINAGENRRLYGEVETEGHFCQSCEGVH